MRKGLEVVTVVLKGKAGTDNLEVLGQLLEADPELPVLVVGQGGRDLKLGFGPSSGVSEL